MANLALDVREWLERLRMQACRFPGQFPPGSADYALEALETVEDDCREDYWGLVDDLNKLTPDTLDCSEDPKKALDYLEGRDTLLGEVIDVLADYTFPDDAIDAAQKVQWLQDRVEELETELKAIRAPAVILPDGTPLEFDL